MMTEQFGAFPIITIQKQRQNQMKGEALPEFRYCETKALPG